jgi:hypothetical protein
MAAMIHTAVQKLLKKLASMEVKLCVQKIW